MCGICGVFTNELTEKHEKIIKNILQDQHPRGPDHQEMIAIHHQKGGVFLGHNRLSIIDLSSHSNQPMWDSSGRYCISYNGEIYNYLELRQILQNHGLTFQSSGDTEVILNAFIYWGIDALFYLEGPFAFALYDKQMNELWLCRDRFGVRPLYYAIEKEQLFFASITRTLAKTLQLKPDMLYVSRGLNYLIYEDNSNGSPYEKMFSVQAGHYLHAKLDNTDHIQITTNQYYNLSQQVEKRIHCLPMTNTNQILEDIYHSLEKSVQLRLRTDVTSGITLSSGLDSSTIASLVRQQHKDVIGFSYGHPDNKKSEGALVANCANYLGIHIEYISPTVDEMIEGLFKTIEIQDAPFSSLSIVAQYLLYKQINASGIKVILGGQGGDEVFMGYRKFMLFQLQHLLKQKQYVASFKHFLQMIPLLLNELRSFKLYWQHRHRYMNGSATTHLLRLPTETMGLSQTHNKYKSLRSRQMEDITHYSLPTLLRYEDRNAMGNSVESRLPFMDHHLVELGCALPETIKLHNGHGKWPIRQIMKNKIPDQIRLARYKRGFDISMSQLLNSGFGKKVRDALQQNQAIVKEFLAPTWSIDSAFSDQQLIERRSALSEAVTLLWLNKVYT